MTVHADGAVVVNGPDFKIDVLDAAEGVFDGAEFFVEAGWDEHAAVADHHDALEPQAAADFPDPLADVGEVAKTSMARGQPRESQAEDDLKFVFFAIAPAAEFAQRTSSAVELTENDLIRQ